MNGNHICKGRDDPFPASRALDLHFEKNNLKRFPLPTVVSYCY